MTVIFFNYVLTLTMNEKDNKLCLILRDFQYLLANMTLDILLVFKAYDLFNKKFVEKISIYLCCSSIDSYI
jgi:hypothetical protein